MTKRDLAQKAINKPSLLGEDIDLRAYCPDTEENLYAPDLGKLATREKQCMLNVGVTPDDMSQRAGTFVQIDHSVIHSSANQDGLELLSTTQALEKYDWLEDYWWHAIDVDTDKFTAYTEIHQNNGYLIPRLSSLFKLVSTLLITT
ncbi:hypothetical protein ES702_02910 [subsurface metagenome]